MAESMTDIIENKELSIDRVVKKIDNFQDKVKYLAFGKTKLKSGRKGGQETDKIHL